MTTYSAVALYRGDMMRYSHGDVYFGEEHDEEKHDEWQGGWISLELGREVHFITSLVDGLGV